LARGNFNRFFSSFPMTSRLRHRAGHKKALRRNRAFSGTVNRCQGPL
jgi:hypothetical protein